MKKRFGATLLLMFVLAASHAQKHHLLIGTYTNTPSKSMGIYSYTFNSKTGDVERIGQYVKAENPSYLTLSADKKTIYAVSESGNNSGLSSINFNWETAIGTTTSFKPTGANPCFVLSDPINVITANYSGGSIDVYAIEKDNSLGALKQRIQHTGRGPDPRQKSAHVHQVQFSPDKKYLVSTDLGEDKVYIYNYQPSNDRPLSFHKTIKLKPGYGPRHLTFSPNGKFMYLTNEFKGTINVYDYRDGDLELLQEIETVASEFKGKIDAADIHISNDGKFLYQTNRGDINAINVYAINAKNGKVTFVQSTSTLGKGPRNFIIDPSGKYILIANQLTNNVVFFKRNSNTGKITPLQQELEIDRPVCLIFK
jgi:6-phosphogluconolactonase